MIYVVLKAYQLWVKIIINFTLKHTELRFIVKKINKIFNCIQHSIEIDKTNHWETK